MMVRCADDCVILCQSREEAENALVLVRKWVEMVFHCIRTRPSWGTQASRGEGFVFLGFPEKI